MLIGISDQMGAQFDRLRYWNLFVALIFGSQNSRVATVLTVYGIETLKYTVYSFYFTVRVATVLTVYGIETL